MKYKAVIFDMDGTLLNTLEDIGEAANRVLRKKDLPQHSIEEYKLFVGEGARRLIERALPKEENSENLVIECLGMFFEEYEKTWNISTQMYPGISSLLDKLEDLPLSKSILSNKPDAFTKSCAAEYLNNWEFSRIMGHDNKIPRKPDPTGAISIATDLNIPPESFLFVGDTKIDMKTASRAGMTGIGVLWGFRSKEELINGGAKALLSDPMELLEFLG